VQLCCGVTGGRPTITRGNLFSLANGGGFAPTSATAGSYAGGYINLLPGISFRLADSMANGKTVDALCFEQSLTLGQAARQVGFAALPVLDASTWAQLALGLVVLGGWGRRARA
jgi:hypothetical protein